MAARALERVQNEKKVTKAERVGKKKWRQSKCSFMTFLLEIWNELFFLLFFFIFFFWILSNMIQMTYSINFFCERKMLWGRKNIITVVVAALFLFWFIIENCSQQLPKKGSPSQNWWFESCLLRRRVILQGTYLIPYHMIFSILKIGPKK